ncbi:MAG: phosphatase PAP2 family protein [Bacteroidota bacterium]
MFEELLEWDRDTFIYLNGLGIEAQDGFWVTITDILTWIPLFMLFVVLLVRKFPKKEAVAAIVTFMALVIFITLLTDFTKQIVARLRPNNDASINTLIRILRNPSSYSFFSGHASSSFSITVLMYLFLRKQLNWALLFFIWPLLFSTSRIYVGVHYPSDIIVGALVGIASGMLFYRLNERFILPYLGSGHRE